MRIIKKLTYILIVAVTGAVIAVVPTKAATKLKITTDTLNLREKASTDSDILTLLSQDETCDLVEEEGDWYKVKYKTYTGYITKEYAEKEEDTTKADTKNDTSSDAKNEGDSKSQSGQNEVENNEAQQGSDKSQPENSEANQDNSNSQADDNKSASDEGKSTEGSSAKEPEASEDVIEITTAKIVDKTDVKLLPLIYSSNISTLSKGTSVMVISETTGWVYIQTDTIAGWVRSVDITDKKTTIDSATDTTGNKTDSKSDSKKDDDSKTDAKQEDKKEESKQEDNKKEEAFKEKEMYTNDSYVNLRKKASTDSDIVMTVETNTKLTVIGEEGDWYKVKTSQGNAYVLKELLSAKQVTTSRGGNVKKKTTSDVEATADSIKTATSASQVSKTTTASTETTKSSTSKQSSSTSTSKKATSSATSSSKSSASSKKSSSSSSSKGSDIVAYAKKFLGVPYVYGGASKSGFDCSGFTMYVYKHFGIKVPHGATSQSKYGKAVKVNKKSSTSIKNNLQAGDLILFSDYETMTGIGHCGIYIGNGKFIHASSGTGYCVKTDSLLPGNYYNTRYCGARRLI